MDPLSMNLASPDLEMCQRGLDEVSRLAAMGDASLDASIACLAVEVLNSPSEQVKEHALRCLKDINMFMPQALAPSAQRAFNIIWDKVIPLENLQKLAGELAENLISKHKVSFDNLKDRPHESHPNSIKLMTLLIEKHGPDRIDLGSCLSPLIELGNSEDLSIIDEVKQFFKAAFAWIGDKVNPYISRLKPSLATEINSFILSQAQVDIEAQYNPDWCERVLSSKKWNEKAQALEELNSHLSKSGQLFGDPELLTNFAGKLLEDTNSNVSLLAVKTIEYLAEVYSCQFSGFARQLIGPVFNKLKEKKPTAVGQVKSTLNKLIANASIDDIQEPLSEILKQQNPGLKQATLTYLEELLQRLDKSSVKRASDIFVKSLIGATDDSNGGVRDASLKCLKVFYEAKLCRAAIEQLPPAKLSKINEGAVPPKAPEVSVPVAAPPPKQQEKRTIPGPQTSLKAPSKPIQDEPGSKQPEVTSAEIESKLLAFMPEELYVCCMKSDWKLRIEGLAKLADWVHSNQEAVRTNVQDLLVYLKLVSNDWKENNVRVLQALYHAITTIVSVGKASNLHCLLTNQAVEKFSETKSNSEDCVIALCRFVSAKEVVKHFAHSLKNLQKPKAKVNGFALVKRILEEFGVKGLPLTELTEVTKAAYGIANPQVKNAAEDLLVCLYSVIGSKITPLLGGLKENQVKALQAKFATVQIKEAPVELGDELLNSAEKTMLGSKISSKTLKELDDANWKVRKGALDKIHGLIKESGRVNHEGLSPLTKSLVRRLSDPNKSLVRNTITLIGDLGMSLGQDGKNCYKGLVRQLSKPVTSPL
mmetsp:Transcript_12268/g.23282  ORF Transcript_12268/g.23282 Transcript_12268/m.23282 type:complete len:817 (+) Transcript_12268:913-3363(+)